MYRKEKTIVEQTAPKAIKIPKLIGNIKEIKRPKITENIEEPITNRGIEISKVVR